MASDLEDRLEQVHRHLLREKDPLHDRRGIELDLAPVELERVRRELEPDLHDVAQDGRRPLTRRISGRSIFPDSKVICDKLAEHAPLRDAEPRKGGEVIFRDAGNDIVDPRPEYQNHHEAENDHGRLRELDGLGDLSLFPGLAELFLGRLFGASLVLRGEELEVEDKTVEERILTPPVVLAECMYDIVCHTLTIIPHSLVGTPPKPPGGGLENHLLSNFPARKPKPPSGGFGRHYGRELSLTPARRQHLEYKCEHPLQRHPHDPHDERRDPDHHNESDHDLERETPAS